MIEGKTDLPLLELYLRRNGIAVVEFVDHSQITHFVEDIFRARSRPGTGEIHAIRGFLDKRIVIIRSFHTPGNKSALNKSQLLGRLIKIVPGSHAKTMAVAAYIKLIGIKFEDLFLGIVIFQT
ncbi:MAG: hypothetical protein ACD_75C02178G0002 [uncultured bacterium]|nr:MAG: hypothetical protein ACD_75C02178G0002 [uncultured bacterium]